MQEIVHEDAPWVFVANWVQGAVTTANMSRASSLQPSFFLNLHDVTKN
jgi:peptide/nickel transport system substrate-binding protein